MKRKTRSDKKFLVKIWIPSHNKAIFRTRCMEYHLSMMFVGEKYLTKYLDITNDEEISLLIEDRIEEYNNMSKNDYLYENIGIRITNEYWQKLAWFAITYHSTISKIGSVIFNKSLTKFELNGVYEQYGLSFNKQMKLYGTTLQERKERISDYS